MMKISGLFFLSFFFYLSCEKAISFGLNEKEPAIVVEATIENGEAPRVILTRSLSFFSEISPELLESSFVHDAVVIMSNGTHNHQLKEYSVPLPNGYRLYYYSTDSTNLATAFEGEFGVEYDLSINVDNQLLEAKTSIPELAKTIDSLFWLPSVNNEDTTKVLLMARASDPPGFGNYIRYFTSNNQGPFLPTLNSVFDDQIIDGKTYTIQIEQGVDRNTEVDFENYSFFNRGDSVIVKLSNIDKATYDFWRTMEFAYSSIGSPFSSPTTVLSNIKGGIGYFGGYASQYISFNIPE